MLRMVVVTGLSGSGRSAALKSFEDMGYYCVDNLPLLLLSAFVEFAKKSEDAVHSAIGLDIREKGFISGIFNSDAVLAMDELNNILADKIKDLIMNNFEKLSNILYRIDVNPEKVNNIFSSFGPAEIPHELARLIIERQLEKVKTRNYYRSQNPRQIE